jgi:hypothetical protein
VADASGLSPIRNTLLGSVVFERTRFDPLVADDVKALRDRSEASSTAPGYSTSGQPYVGPRWKEAPRPRRRPIEEERSADGACAGRQTAAM